MSAGASCRSCGAAILWGLTAKGHVLPLDVEPVAEGNVLLHSDGSVTVLSKEALEEARLTNAPLRLSHHATCPDGRTWRRS